MSTIQLKNVTVAFDETPVFENLNLTLGDGEKVTIHGAAGSGASVLIKVLSGLIEPRAGSVRCDGTDFTYPIDRQFFRQRQRISYLLEDLEPLANLTVFENIALHYRLSTELPEKEIRGLVMNKLRSVQLEGKAHLRPVKLSRDDQIVLTLIMNLKEDTGLMVIDEAFFNLKSPTLQRIRDSFSNRIRQKNTTVVMREVDETAIQFAASRKITLTKGRILTDEAIQ